MEKEERGFGDGYFDEKKRNNDDEKIAYSPDEEMLIVVFWEVRNCLVSQYAITYDSSLTLTH